MPENVRYRAKLEGNLFRCLRARAHLRALMTRKSCAVGICIGNHTVSSSI